MKKIAYIVLTLIILFIFTAGAAAESGAGMKSFTVAEAQKLAEINSRQAVMDDLDIKAKEIALVQAREDARLAGYKYGSESITSNRIKMDVRVFESEAALEEAKRNKQDNEKLLKLEIRNSFMNILLTQKELEKETRKLGFLEERLKMAKAKYDAKMITEGELDSALFNVNSKANDNEGVKARLQTLDMKLKGQLELPLGGEMLKLEGVIEMESFPEVDIDKEASAYLETDRTVFAAAQKYEAARKTMELSEKLLRPGSPTYDSNKISLEAVLRDYETAKRNSEVNIRNAYNDLLNLKDSAELAIKYEELQLKIKENIKTKYDKGQISRDAYISSEEQYEDALFAKYSAIAGYNTKRREFLNKIKKDF